MKIFLNFITEYILPIGGISVLISAFTAFLSRLWADMFLHKKLHEYDRQIEHYKNTLELEREKYKALNEQTIHKNKLIFDTEFEIYKEISSKLINTVEELFHFLVLRRLSEESFNNCQTQYLDFHSSISKYASFIEKDMYNLINEFSIHIGEVIINKRFDNKGKYGAYKNGNIETETDWETYNELSSLYEDINNRKTEIIDTIRRYLRSLAEIQ